MPAILSAQFLPGLVTLGSSLLQATPAPAAPENIARLLHLILKVYRLSITNDLSPHHQDIQGSLVPWGTFCLQIVARQLDPAAMPEDTESRERCGWWKAKKWAYFDLARLFSRYGSPSQLHENLTAKYTTFAENFEAHFAPEIFKSFLKQVELYVQDPNGQWLSERVRKIIIDFFEECIKPKATWNLLRPHLPLLLQHFLFPLLCPTSDEISEFEDNPVEYARYHASESLPDFFVRTDVAVLNMIEMLVPISQESCLYPSVTIYYSNDE